MTQHDHPKQEDEDLCSDIKSQAYTSKFVSEYDIPLSICVVEAVAEAIETDPKDLQPIYEAIDPDALNQLFESAHQFRRGCIMFRYEGCSITVDADGWIAVSPRMGEE
jgi:hypothetical protein